MTIRYLKPSRMSVVCVCVCVCVCVHVCVLRKVHNVSRKALESEERVRRVGKV